MKFNASDILDYLFDFSRAIGVTRWTLVLLAFVAVVLMPAAFGVTLTNKQPIKPAANADIDLRIPVRVVKNLDQGK